MNKQENKTASVEELYIREKKKATIFMASTALLAMLFVGSLVLNTSGMATDQTAQGDSQQARGPGGGRGAQSITSFFDESGELDQTAVDTLTERLNQTNGPTGADPTQFLEQFTAQIDTAVENNEITSQQAAELKAALEAATSEN